MSDSIPISIEFTGDKETSVEFPEEQMTVSLELTQVGPRLFRIGSVPIMVEAASFGDVIEAESGADGSLRFVRVGESGGWRTYDFMLSAELIGSERITSIQDRVLSLGGHWERVFGGILLLCLPPTTDYDPIEDIQREP
jgi:hypothetical protein